MSKLATIVGPLGSRRRAVVASLLGFVIGTVIGTLIFHRLYFTMWISAICSIGLYFRTPKFPAKFTDIKL